MTDTSKTTEGRLRGDPERDAGWLVSTPWKGLHMAVFSADRGDAVRQAEQQRDAKVQLLEKQAKGLREMTFEVRRVEAVTDGE